MLRGVYSITSAERRNLTRQYLFYGTWKPCKTPPPYALSMERTVTREGLLMVLQEREVGRSEGQSVMGWIRIQR
tara:strand:- start:897 stop:1118 length:222 start_codon:yes stop_codon:yes gene_type:complete